MVSNAATTLIVLAAPFLIPRVYSFIVPILFPSPPGTRTPIPPSAHLRQPIPLPPPSPSSLLFRLLLATLGISFTLFTAFLPPSSQNIFLYLATPTTLAQIIFPVLRTPVDVRTPTEALASEWGHSTSLSDAQLSLLSSLQTLDNRLLYINHGPTPILACTWCRKPGSSDISQVNADYLMSTLPNLALSYLACLAVVGLLTGFERRYARKWAVGVLIIAAAVEVYRRTLFAGIIGGKVVMLHSHLHLLRHLFFAFVLLGTFLLPPSSAFAPPQYPTAAQITHPALHNIASRVDMVRERVRAAGLQRMALLHKGENREKVNNFWRRAEDESRVAHEDPIVKEIFKKEAEKEDDKVFTKWIRDTTMGVGGQVPPPPPAVTNTSSKN